MPLDREVLEALHLGKGFLNVVLAERALPGRPGRAQRRRREGLAHRHQVHRRRVAAGRQRRGLDAGADRLQPLRDGDHNA
jgi:hypothetical protein